MRIKEKQIKLSAFSELVVSANRANSENNYNSSEKTESVDADSVFLQRNYLMLLLAASTEPRRLANKVEVELGSILSDMLSLNFDSEIVDQFKCEIEKIANESKKTKKTSEDKFELEKKVDELKYLKLFEILEKYYSKAVDPEKLSFEWVGNLSKLKSVLGLKEIETSLLEYSFAFYEIKDSLDVSDAISDTLRKNLNYHGALESLLNCSKKEVKNLLFGKNALITHGLVVPCSAAEIKQDSADGFFDALGLDFILDYLNKPHADERELIFGLITEKINKSSVKSNLDEEDFPHLTDNLKLCKALLSSEVEGLNLLIYGSTGVGKTEFSKLIAKLLGKTIIEIPTESIRESTDFDSSKKYIKSRAAQFLELFELVSEFNEFDSDFAKNHILLFDEAEDMFPSEDSYVSGLDRISKFQINKILETNKIPTIWIANKVDQIDKAFIRRFSYCVEFKTPPREVRLKLITKFSKGLSLTDSQLEKFAAYPDFSVAAIKTICSAVRSLPNELQISQFEKIVEANRKAMGLPVNVPKSSPVTNYNLKYLNVEPNLVDKFVNLPKNKKLSFMLYGVSGSGKTELAKYLAEILGLKFKQYTGSSLLKKYVGESEVAIREMFRTAEENGELVLLDECDSLLTERGSSEQEWKISIVNEFLSCLESFSGVFVGTTNRLESTDTAFSRRITFKIKFSSLKAEQRSEFIKDYLASMYSEHTSLINSFDFKVFEAEKYESLAIGDVVTAMARYEILNKELNFSMIESALLSEIDTKSRQKADADVKLSGL